MIRVYIAPTTDATTFEDEIEVTDDIVEGGLSSLKRNLNDDYGFGVMRFSNFTLSLRNDHGLYSDPSIDTSVFPYTRNGSKVRITWDFAPPAICGAAICGESYIGEEVTIYRGILSDETTKVGAQEQEVRFTVLGLESVLSTVLAPVDDFEISEDVMDDSIGQITETIFALPEISKYITYDAELIENNFSGFVYQVDHWKNETCQTVIEELLTRQRCWLYVNNEGKLIIESTDTSPSEDDPTFLGFGASGINQTVGNQNVIDLVDYRDGQNNIVNHVTIADTDHAYGDSTSIAKWGLRTRELDIKSGLVADDNSLGSNWDALYVNRFKDPRPSVKLKVPITYEFARVKFFIQARVLVPEPAMLNHEGDLQDVSTFAVWDGANPQWRVFGCDVDLKEETMTFTLVRI